MENYYWLVSFSIEKLEKKETTEEKYSKLIVVFSPDTPEIYNAFYKHLIDLLGKFYMFPHENKEKLTLQKVFCLERGSEIKELSRKMREFLESEFSNNFLFY